jgi:hypothetical protein
VFLDFRPLRQSITPLRGDCELIKIARFRNSPALNDPTKLLSNGSVTFGEIFCLPFSGVSAQYADVESQTISCVSVKQANPAMLARRKTRRKT